MTQAVEYAFEKTGDPADWKPPGGPKAPEPQAKLVRPAFSVALMALDFGGGFFLLTLVASVLLGAPASDVWPPLLGGYAALRAKQILLWAIMLYQRFAPERIRRVCALNPTCSEYMYLAIVKYGVLPGIAKGVSRLLRCDGAPQTAEDYP